MEYTNAKYNVGDVVKVRSDLSENHGASTEMIRKWAGKEVTIKDTTAITLFGRMPFYTIVEGGFVWGDDMFECLVRPANSAKSNKMPELTTGMFGVDDTGDRFVVVGRTLVYQQSGLLDCLDDDIYDPTEWVEALYECECFDDIEDGTAKVIWERSKIEEQPPADTEEEKEADANLEDVTAKLHAVATALKELFGDVE